MSVEGVSQEFERYVLSAAREYGKARVKFEHGSGSKSEMKHTGHVLKARAMDLVSAEETNTASEASVRLDVEVDWRETERRATQGMSR